MNKIAKIAIVLILILVVGAIIVLKENKRVDSETKILDDPIEKVALTEIQAVKTGKPFSIALAVSLTLMLILRIPNQICVALHESHGWYSVLGTAVGALGFAMLAYMTYQTAEKEKKTKSI